MTEAALLRTAKGWLRDIGYRPAWLVGDYRFMGQDGPYVVDCAAFGSDTHDMENSCIAVEFRPLNGKTPPNHPSLRFLAAPVVWEVDSRRLRTWKLTPDRFEFIRDVPLARVDTYLAQQRDQMSPRALLAAKRSGATQLDLVDAGLLNAARDATASLLYDEFYRTVDLARKRYGRQISNGELRALLVGTLQLMTARAFEDKLGWDIQRPGRSLSELLGKVNQHVGDMLPVSSAEALPSNVAALVFDLLTSRLAFASATPDVLSMIYWEPALEATDRRALGAYYTPRSVADYIFSVLPIEDIPADDLFVLDPTCGSGNLLVAAYHACSRALADRGMSAHDALCGRGHGIDKDAVACEASRSAMLLCSVPRTSGWQVSNADFFRTSRTRLGIARCPTVIVANPPFGKGQGVEERAALALRRSLDWLADGGLIGIVVPETFSVKGSCYDARAELLEQCHVLDVLRLPRDIFPKSRAATQVICAQKTRASDKRYAWIRVVTTADRDHFRAAGPAAVSRAFRYPVDAWRSASTKSLTGSHLFEVWEEVRRAAPGRLCDAFRVRRGFEFIPGAKPRAIVTRAAAGELPCIASARRLAQFRLSGPEEFVQLSEVVQNTVRRADTPLEKVVLCRTSTAAKPWRIWAAHDEGGKVIYKTFLYAVPTHDEDPWLLVALLNSKVANAWFYSFNPTRDVLVKAVSDIPWPLFEASTRRDLCDLARALQGCADSCADAEGRLRGANQLDSLVFDAFKIGPAGRQLVSELFLGEERPGFGVEAPRAEYSACVLPSSSRGCPRGAYEVIGRVVYVDRSRRVVYCDLGSVAPGSLVAVPLDEFPVKLAAAGLSFATFAAEQTPSTVAMTEPRPLDIEGITYGEAYEMLAPRT